MAQHLIEYMQIVLPRRQSGCHRPTPNEPVPRHCSSSGPSLWWHSLQPSLSIVSPIPSLANNLQAGSLHWSNAS
jgi:hypothetical protein